MVRHLKRVVRFIEHKANDYGVNPDQIERLGGSATGYLSLLIGASPEIPINGATQQWEANQATVFAVFAIVAFAAPTDRALFVADNPKEIEKRPVLRLSDKQYNEFSPVNYITTGDPPTLIMQTKHSPTIEQAQRGISEALEWFKNTLSAT